jgi:hypothetical protein
MTEARNGCATAAIQVLIASFVEDVDALAAHRAWWMVPKVSVKGVTHLGTLSWRATSTR